MDINKERVNLSNEELVVLLQKGDQSIYNDLEKRFHPMFWKAIYTFKLGYDKDEYFQIIRIKFYEACMCFDSSCGIKLTTFIMRSIYNMLINHIRDNNFKNADLNGDYLLDDYVFENDNDENFEYMISNLSDDEKYLLRNYFVYGRTLVEMSKIYNQSFKWISNRIKAAINKLRGDYL